jgi:hypothetical protein
VRSLSALRAVRALRTTRLRQPVHGPPGNISYQRPLTFERALPASSEDTWTPRSIHRTSAAGITDERAAIGRVDGGDVYLLVTGSGLPCGASMG